MESSSEKIKKIISQIIFLLEVGEQGYWLSYFKHILEDLTRKNDSREFIRELSQIFKGGMGSFSDLVLYKNGMPLIEENNQLDSLKDNLFDACKEFLRN